MPEWHPRQNAYPIAWECRNGRYADPYALIRRLASDRFEVTDTAGRVLGEWPTGDEAAAWAWDWHLERDRRPRSNAPNGQP